jgi:hypothetical protein
LPQKQAFTSRFDNKRGREIFTFSHTLDCAVRQDNSVPKTETATESASEEKEATAPVAVDNSETDSASNESGNPTNTKIEGDHLDNGELISQNWRLISAVKVWPSSDFYYPQLVDYTHNSGQVLKDAIPLINSSHPDLLWNHSVNAHDVAGYVDMAEWEDSLDIPPGVNAKVIVDPQFDAKAAIGLSKGFIRSGSIGITMDCEKSHPDMSNDNFVANQGEIIDGKEVRWLPVQILAVRHMAMLPTGTGADPHAGIRVSQQEEKETKVDTTNNIQDQKITEQKNTDVQVVQNQQNITTDQEPHTEVPVKNKGERMGEERLALLADLAEKLGIEVALSEEAALPEGLGDRLVKRIEKLSAFADKYNKLCAKVEALGEKVNCTSFDQIFDTLSDKVELAKHGEKLIEHYRKEAVKWFDASRVALNKKEMSEAEKRMRNRIENSNDLDYLEDVATDYKAIAESNITSKRSSEGSDVPKESNIEEEIKNAEIRASAGKLWSKQR